MRTFVSQGSCATTRCSQWMAWAKSHSVHVIEPTRSIYVTRPVSTTRLWQANRGNTLACVREVCMMYEQCCVSVGARRHTFTHPAVTVAENFARSQYTGPSFD